MKMGKRGFYFLVILVVLFLIVGCSERQEEITGNSIKDGEVNALKIVVKSDNGTLVKGAEIYINGDFKAKTREFGSSKGTRTLLLTEENSVLEVRKRGYNPSESILIKPSGNSMVTVTLRASKTELVVAVKEKRGPVRDATVVLYRGEERSPEEIKQTNRDGKATFSNLDDGDYVIRVNKEGYESGEEEFRADQELFEQYVTKNIELKSPPVLEISVVDEEGNSLDEAEVSLYTRKEYNKPRSWPILTRFVDENGELRLGNVHYGERYIIVVKREGYYAEIKERVLQEDDFILKVQMSSESE